MRKELYKKLIQCLKGIGAPAGTDTGMIPAHEYPGDIKHIDLWNRNVEFIDEEAPWARPAVFIEFGPITWTSNKELFFRGHGTLRLHIVTDWKGSAAADNPDMDAALEDFQYSEKIQKAICDIVVYTQESSAAVVLDLKETYTNHDHEEIVENIDVYEMRYTRII